MSDLAPVRLMSASGQLGYGVLEPAFRRGIDHEPDMIGADMGSVDPGPAYLGMGRIATDPEMTRRDLTLLLEGARDLDVPLIIGTAGTAGAGAKDEIEGFGPPNTRAAARSPRVRETKGLISEQNNQINLFLQLHLHIQIDDYKNLLYF